MLRPGSFPRPSATSALRLRIGRLPQRVVVPGFPDTGSRSLGSDSHDYATTSSPTDAADADGAADHPRGLRIPAA